MSELDKKMKLIGEMNKLNELIKNINDSTNKTYNCIIGVSGGVDSTYVALLAKKLGFKPLLVHFDNGWNSEIAVSNINNIANKSNANCDSNIHK